MSSKSLLEVVNIPNGTQSIGNALGCKNGILIWFGKSIAVVDVSYIMFCIQFLVYLAYSSFIRALAS